jgi:hypothetical protein
MAYIGHGNTGNRDGHGWAIAAAFAGQAAIIVGIGALLTGGSTSAATQVSAVPFPAVAAPQPAFSKVPDIQPLTDFPYQVTMDGQSAAAVFPDSPSVPSFTVKPGQGLTITLDVTVPPAKSSATDLSVNLIGGASDAGGPDIQAPSNDTVQPLSLGAHVFALSPGTTQVLVLRWPGSASELKPGTLWTLFMSAGTPDGGDGAPIATITVAS